MIEKECRIQFRIHLQIDGEKDGKVLTSTMKLTETQIHHLIKTLINDPDFESQTIGQLILKTRQNLIERFKGELFGTPY
jgi:hypothetical protein